MTEADLDALIAIDRRATGQDRSAYYRRKQRVGGSSVENVGLHVFPQQKASNTQRCPLYYADYALDDESLFINSCRR